MDAGQRTLGTGTPGGGTSDTGASDSRRVSEPGGVREVGRVSESGGARGSSGVSELGGAHESGRVSEAHAAREATGVSREGDRADVASASGEVPEPTVVDPVSAPDAQGRARRTTRRFPLFTRDTARPEGGGRAASGDAPAPVRQWPILVVLGAVGVGLLMTALDVFRYGLLLIGAALLAGAVLRWVVPDVGMLAVRSRFTDMVTYTVLGTAIVLLSMMAQPNPWLTIPFLDDTLHYTISSQGG